jgi:hypothetical protein
MESNIEAGVLPKQQVEQAFQGWEQIEEKLGLDLEWSAKETKALQRKREISSARDLLRLILFYASSDWSLKLVGAWAMLKGIGFLSDVAILKRLRSSKAWVGSLVCMLMQKRVSALKRLPGVRLRVVDATTINAPGSKHAAVLS